MLLFESDLYALYAVGTGLAIGLPLYTLTVRLATRGLEKLFPRKA